MSIDCASINAFSSGCALTSLDEQEGIWGRLNGITKSDRGTLIVAIEGASIELPAALSEVLEPLVGQHVIVGLFGGLYRVGRCSA